MVIDEVSMISTLMLNEISENLNQAKDSQSKGCNYFGGINILFTGDFCQLPPFGGFPLYQKTANENTEFINLNSYSKTYEKAMNGRLIWKQITHSVILTEQMRQSNDIEFLKLLQRLRTGNYDEDSVSKDFELLNKYKLTPDDISSNDWKNAKVIVSRNYIREQINLYKINNYSKETGKIIYNCKSNDNLIKHGNDQLINKRLKVVLKKLTENKTDNMMTELPLIEGGKYYLTKNIATTYGLVNGTEVELISICTNDKSLNTMPEYLLVKIINDNQSKKIKFNDLPDNIIPLFIHENTFSVNLESNYLKTKSVSIRRKQFPLTLAYALTHYKAQGKTLNKIIVDLSKPIGKLDFSYSYVVLSRAKKLKDIKILRDFDVSMLKPKLPESLITELQRLKDLERN